MEIEKRNKFLRVQTCVLAGSNQVSKWTLGEHVHFASPEQVPLEPKAILGTGGSGQVEVVALRSQTRIAHPAFDKRLVRKLIKRKVFGPHQEGLAVFKNELEVLKRLQHRHLVEIIGSYTDPTFAALIMSPVADCDLAYFMKIAATDNQRLSSLRTFFGCLATALAYLHKMRIRHKDIKPPNILVHGTNVLITDFGLARDCNDTRSTTEGPTGRTPKYAAPEVVMYAPRNFSSDIWSLGCVYLEMLTVLEGDNLEQLKHFMSENGTQNIHYHANEDGVDLWILKFRNGPNSESIGGLLDWIQVMLTPDRDLRPSADTIAAEIANTQSSSGRIGEFCGICCREEDVYFTDVEMEGDSVFIPESLTNELDLEDVKVIQSLEDSTETASRFEMEDARPLEPSRDNGIGIAASGSGPRPAVLMHEVTRNTLRTSIMHESPL
ncbi:hypothetical protein N0V83_000113 [Neocucurbitaria cava]|uniref:Protein kinase domain-containing protein n=1 Tax=Neocucurbitaria cava TaxID=798079 RepID=A0A9W9CRT5_9PLEO|nr:hypothetical protein N0V83_000113 [Neocucurbitaria cava]